MVNDQNLDGSWWILVNLQEIHGLCHVSSTYRCLRPKPVPLEKPELAQLPSLEVVSGSQREKSCDACTQGGPLSCLLSSPFSTEASSQAWLLHEIFFSSLGCSRDLFLQVPELFSRLYK